MWLHHLSYSFTKYEFQWKWVFNTSMLPTRSHSAALYRCIKMHHGYISSHILVRTACQGLFPLGSMWQGIRLCQQFRPMIDGIQALNCRVHSVPTLHTLISKGRSSLLVFVLRVSVLWRGHKNMNEWKNETQMNWPHTVAEPLQHQLESPKHWTRMENCTMSHNLIQLLNKLFLTDELVTVFSSETKPVLQGV